MKLNRVMYREVREECYGLLIRVMLGKFPSAKQKYFYGSGLWNPTYYLESVGKNRFYQKLHKEAKILLWTSNKTK